TRNERKAAMLGRRMDELEERIAELETKESLASLRPELDGNAVMAQLGIGPGRAVGEALAFMMDIRLDEGLLGEDEARARLDGRIRAVNDLALRLTSRGRTELIGSYFTSMMPQDQRARLADLWRQLQDGGPPFTEAPVFETDLPNGSRIMLEASVDLPVEDPD